MTTDVTDGMKTSLNIGRTDLEEVPVEEYANKDGTLARSSSSDLDRPIKQSLLEKFFENKKPTFNKRTKDKGPVIAEGIEFSDSDEDGHVPKMTNWDEEVKRAATPSAGEERVVESSRVQSSEHISSRGVPTPPKVSDSDKLDQQSSRSFNFKLVKQADPLNRTAASFEDPSSCTP